MSLSHRYQEFGNFRASEPVSATLDAEALEDQKLESFEAGYQAGWDDAVKAQSDDKARIGAEFAQNLQDMSFTYHEALSRLTGAMAPMIGQIVDKLLPAMSRDVLGAHVLEQLTELVREQAGQPVEIVVAPSNVEAIEAIAKDQITAPFTLLAETSLGEGQAFVRIGGAERQIDLDGVIAGIRQAMDAVFQKQAPGA